MDFEGKQAGDLIIHQGLYTTPARVGSRYPSPSSSLAAVLGEGDNLEEHEQ